LNLEVGRLRGWLKDPLHATEEFDITLDEAQEYWESNFVITAKDVKNLLPEKPINNNSSSSIITNLEVNEELEISKKEFNDEVTDIITLTLKEDVEEHLEDNKIYGADGNTYIQASLFK